MALNRLDRDTILNRALDLVDSPVLDTKDRPSGTIVSTALSITWLQEALDLFAKKFPFSQVLVEAPITIPQNNQTVTRSKIAVPSDFIIDFQDGILLDEDEGRLQRRSLAFLLNLVRGTGNSPVTETPTYYAVVDREIFFHPQADRQYTGSLWYYKLAPVLGATDTPSFPDDHILVQYVWIKGQEWHRILPPGSALTFAEKIIADLQKAGIGTEAEPDVIPLDRRVFGDRVIEDRFVKVTTTSGQ